MSRRDAGIVQAAALHVFGRGAKTMPLLLGDTHPFSVAVLQCSLSHSVTHLPRPPQVALSGRTTVSAMPRPASRRW